jgi:hypothetical protein
MKLATFLAVLLFSMPALTQDVPTPPPMLCVEQNCTTTSDSSGYQFPSGPTNASAATLKAVPTFHNVGLYWDEGSGSESNEALVRFRKVGTSAWRQGLSLWFDKRTPDRIPYGFEQYRGSLVELDPGATYEVEVLTTGSRRLASTQVTTWKETFPVGTTVTLPTNSSSTLSITQSGTPTGYRLYTHAPGESASIDGANKIDSAVVISGSYVIVRGLTLKNVREYAISVSSTAHHVVIEGNDISKFGHADPVMPQFGCNQTGGIGTASQTGNLNVKQLVIQSNRIHHPNFDANSWAEARLQSPNCSGAKGAYHPQGPGAIFLKDTGGNHVVRYNEIYSDLTHMFNDGIGGGQNFSTAGPYPRDSDIYGNRVSHVWDDAIEAEGANMNVRIYGNHIELAMVSVAAAPVSIGPLYVFRNVATKGIRSPAEMNGYGWFYKTRNKSTDGTIAGIYMGGGRAYLFHNTLYRTSTDDSIRQMLSVDALALVNIVARNNIINSKSATSSALVPFLYCDFNFDMFSAGHTAWSSEEIYGIEANPVYDGTSTSGKYALKAGSPGQDAGTVIPNFNDRYSSGGPDVGAQEQGWKALQFGPR